MYKINDIKVTDSFILLMKDTARVEKMKAVCDRLNHNYRVFSGSNNVEELTVNLLDCVYLGDPENGMVLSDVNKLLDYQPEVKKRRGRPSARS